MPHGSILGQLFILYINDMHLAMEFSTIYNFGDDVNHLHSCKTRKELHKNVNADLKKIV